VQAWPDGGLIYFHLLLDRLAEKRLCEMAKLKRCNAGGPLVFRPFGLSRQQNGAFVNE
jgi:hypothetical protein